MTANRWRVPIGASLLAVALVAPAGVAAQPPPAQQAPAPPAEPAAPAGQAVPTDPAVPIAPADLDRIRRAIGSDPAVRIDDDELRFFMQILAKRPTFAEFSKGYDFKNGPTRGGNPMTHAEFLAMVTPREMQSQVGITASETLQFALTNWLGQTLIKKAFEDIQKARTEQEIREIRERIERELALLGNDDGKP